ncbi:MAG: hypothetical protein N3B13_04025, partial [Deltaproteobacteria bacterium]|nr:hypothetical protein [Deltaproteobacteria bacterium]
MRKFTLFTVFVVFLYAGLLYGGSISSQLLKPYDYSIMQTESRIDILVKNTSSNSSDVISQIRFSFPNGYTITQGNAQNWVVQSIVSPRITFIASGCSYKLNPGDSMT